MFVSDPGSKKLFKYSQSGSRSPLQTPFKDNQKNNFKINSY
jgi:hypothetical protein